MKPALLSAWQIWALLSACFAALTAIFAKIGVENINPDLATFIRTVVVLLAFSVLLVFTGQFAVPSEVSSKTWLFLGHESEIPQPGDFVLRPMSVAQMPFSSP